uniref:Nuclear receptor domain-containing protein n=1 Tax=Panagrellus redivivus TaxID=6233 RepID=A0A7E4UVI0_PANRE
MNSFFVEDDEAQSVEPMECLICQNVAHGYHFGILSCRACAAFFRRTVILQRNYKCIGKRNNCEVNKDKKMCRACRLAKCERLGMNKKEIQANRDPIRPKKPNASNGQTVQTNSNNTPVNIPDQPTFESLETLERLKEGCIQYYIDQKSLAPDDRKYTYIDYAKYTELYRTTIPMILKMLKNNFSPFEKLDLTTKKHILQNFYVKHHTVEILFQTYRNADSLPPNAWIFFNGYIFDDADVGSIVGQSPIREEIKKLSRSMVVVSTNTKRSFEKLQIDEMERAAMAGIMLWQEVISFVPSWKDAHDAQEKVLKELHAYVIQKCGLKSTGSRIGAFMCVINEVEDMTRLFMERMTMEAIFNTVDVEIWDGLDF